jgi:AcrR family transcriptional regulator
MDKPSKGARTRGRILRAALRRFSEDSFERVTTRQIAADADVRQPVISHYFSDKSALYMACAEAVVRHYHERPLSASTEAARQDLKAGSSREAASAQLRVLVAELANFMAQSDAMRPESRFIVREMAQAGPAFDLLYEQVVSPGFTLVAELISLAHPGGPDPLRARIEALLLIGGVASFEIDRPVVQRFLGADVIVTPQFREAVVRGYIQRLYP